MVFQERFHLPHLSPQTPVFVLQGVPNLQIPGRATILSGALAPSQLASFLCPHTITARPNDKASRFRTDGVRVNFNPLMVSKTKADGAKRAHNRRGGRYNMFGSKA